MTNEELKYARELVDFLYKRVLKVVGGVGGRK